MSDIIVPEGLDVCHDGGVLRITLDRPERRNALTDDMIDALVLLVEAAENDEAIRVIALAGRGESFCSGFDLGQRGKPEVPPRLGATQRRMRRDVNRLVETLLECQTPVVAVAQGWIVGLGLALVLAADIAIVADDAVLRAPFARIGMTPDSGLSWLLPRLVGVARAKQMLLLGRDVSGATAAAWGLVAESVPTADLDGAGEAIVQELAAAATVAVGLAKDLVHRGLTRDVGDALRSEAIALELASRTDDFKEPRRAKRDARPVEFRGR